MQFFIQQSELYKEIGDGFNLTEEMVDMTDVIRNGLEKVKNKDYDQIDLVTMLLYTHKWRLKELYDELVIEVKRKIFLTPEFDTVEFEKKFNKDIWSDVFKTEAEISTLAGLGKLSLVKIAHENGCPWDEKTCSVAALHGHLECLKYAHENGCDWGDERTTAAACCNGNLDCLKYP